MPPKLQAAARMSLSPEPCPFSNLCRLALPGVCDCCESCSELLDRSLKRTNELSEKVVLGRNLGKSHYTRGVEYLVADPALSLKFS